MSDQNTGPIYSVELPKSLPSMGEWTNPVPSRDDLVRMIKAVGDRSVASYEAALAIVAAVERSGFDLAPCIYCEATVVFLSPLLPCCKPCADKEGAKWL